MTEIQGIKNRKKTLLAYIDNDSDDNYETNFAGRKRQTNSLTNTIYKK